MQVSFSYAGQPSVTLVVSVPKLRTEKLPVEQTWNIRYELLVLLTAISEENKNHPDLFATEIFKQVKAQRQDLILSSVIFGIDQGDGNTTSLCFLKSDLNL